MVRTIRLRIWFLFFCSQNADAFLPTRASRTAEKLSVVEMGGDNDEEVYIVAQAPERQNDSLPSSPSPPSEAMNYMDDLTPPPINFKRDSILFSDNPSTQRKNEALDFWKYCKTNLPPVITGSWPWRPQEVADDNPVGALYNIAFVRMPVIGVFFLYIQNLLQGHPLIMDIGKGPTEISPLIVLSVLALILA